MKNQKKTRVYVVALAVFLVAAIAVWDFMQTERPKTAVEPGEEAIQAISIVNIVGKTLQVDLALTDEEKARGLSGRESLDEDEGMLFVFDVPGNYGFWMKDMNFAIDIIWLNEKITPFIIIGMFLITTGVIVAEYHARKRRNKLA